MATETARTPWYEVLSKLSPLVLGIFITGGGAWATNRVQEGQLQLSQVNSLFLFLPKMQSKNAAECVSAFEAFTGDSLEQLVVHIIDRTKEPCGRPKLRAVAQSANRETRELAENALRNLPIQVFMRDARRYCHRIRRQPQPRRCSSKNFLAFSTHELASGELPALPGAIVS
jgi:hypothetical protein